MCGAALLCYDCISREDTSRGASRRDAHISRSSTGTAALWLSSLSVSASHESAAEDNSHILSLEGIF